MPKIMMFKKAGSGDEGVKTAVVRGVECDFIRIELISRPHYKELGYMDSEKEVHGIAEREEDQEDEELFRLKAKELGIKNWHNKKIESLISEIEAAIQ